MATPLSITPSKILVGLSWDLLDKGVDLDVAAVVLDDMGAIIEAAYFKQLSCLSGAITHSGDSLDGVASGDDETITIDVTRIGPEVRAVMFLVNCQNGDFTHVETAALHVSDVSTASAQSAASTELMQYSLGVSGTSTAFVAGALYRDQTTSQWMYKSLEKAGAGRDFQQSIPLIESVLATEPHIVNPMMLSERPRDPHKRFDLQKNELYVMDKSLDTVVMGLGWDPAPGSQSLDVDASCAVYSTTHEHLEDVYFSHREAFHGAIRHSGDNLTGEGTGDDEQIIVNLRALPAHVGYLLFTVTIWSGAESFSAIRQCFARMCNAQGSQELCRLTLGEGTRGRGQLLAAVTRTGQFWSLRALGIALGASSVGSCRLTLSQYVDAPESFAGELLERPAVPTSAAFASTTASTAPATSAGSATAQGAVHGRPAQPCCSLL
eukprot:TRINITY_DN9903_c0_g1_i1.p1 TRINITY_DN9903_c0_g1~~TRINITY_DN9903_c0_g1_i1.p1  ORF type:complete len:436 (-),score=95.48 TRINITY_DN9903_c0_g1_i1:121-1428(-)